MKNILITGGCGFIGSNLVDAISNSDYELTILDNFTHGKLGYINETKISNLIEGDIRDQRMLNKVVADQDIIIHLAAFGSVVDSVSNPNENFQINALGTFNVLEAARCANVTKVIFASTGGALFGNAMPPVDENSLPKPISPYGASKLSGEGYCSAFATAYGMNITALRFANVIGPNSWHKKGAITAFFKSIIKEENIIIYGDGSATRDFLYVEDLCNGIMSAVKLDDDGFSIFHLSSGKDVSIKELAYLCKEVADVPNHPVLYESKRAGEIEKNFANYDLAENKLNFIPMISLTDGLKRTWNSYQDYYK